MGKVFEQCFSTEIVSNEYKWHEDNTKSICLPVSVFYAGKQITTILA